MDKGEKEYYKKAIGSRIQAARLAKGLRICDVTERLATYQRNSSARIARYEKGECCPRIFQLIEIAEALGVEPYTLLPDAFTPQHQPNQFDDFLCGKTLRE